MSSSKQNISVDVHGSFTVIKVYAEIGLFTHKGEILFTLEEKSTGEKLTKDKKVKTFKVKADTSGKTLKILKRAGAEVTFGYEHISRIFNSLVNFLFIVNVFQNLPLFKKFLFQ